MEAAGPSIPGLDRREGHRARYAAEVEYVWRAAKDRGRVYDLSLGGMLIETNDPLPAGAEFMARLSAGEGAPVEIVCVVKRIVLGLGMGVEFSDIKPADLSRLRQVIEGLPH